MAEENNQNDNNTSKTFSLMATIKEKINGANKEIEDRVTNLLVEEQVASRANKIVKALETLTSLQKELAKIKKPDNVLYDEAGKPSQELFSKDRLNQINEQTKKMEKLHKAINAALEGDWSQLK